MQEIPMTWALLARLAQSLREREHSAGIANERRDHAIEPPAAAHARRKKIFHCGLVRATHGRKIAVKGANHCK
jgi:hypothetical protein